VEGQVLWVVWHNAQGTGQSLYATFANPSRDASAHFGVWADGTVEQYVDTNDTAWTNGCGSRPVDASIPLLTVAASKNACNDCSVSIEFAGFDGSGTEPFQPLSAEQFKAGVELTRWAFETHEIPGLPQFRRNLLEHRFFAPTLCPGGRVPWAEVEAALHGFSPPELDDVLRFWWPGQPRERALGKFVNETVVRHLEEAGLL
jgi:N-acetyl-anhydromuramyl-L-alanine amidase AmpD